MISDEWGSDSISFGADAAVALPLPIVRADRTGAPDALIPLLASRKILERQGERVGTCLGHRGHVNGH
jgi:hypothetical protein